MNKIALHLKNYAAIYLIVALVICITAIVYFRPSNSKSEEQEAEYDTSMFNVVDTQGAIDLFKGNRNQVLFIGRKSCSACQTFIPYLKIAMAQYHFYVSYLDLESMDPKSSEYAELMEYFDYEYTYQGKTAKFSEYMGYTPMFIIIKNHRMVFGYLGSMSNETVGAFVTQYGITY